MNPTLFRASSLGRLMTESRKKGELSDTAKTLIREKYIEDVYGRKKLITSPAMEKGLYVEEESLSLVCRQTGKLLIKNNTLFTNDYISGTPDVVSDSIVEIKSSQDLWTFTEVSTVDPAYYWQCQAYLWLTGKQTANLYHVLVDAPDHMIEDAKRRAFYSVNGEDSEKIRNAEEQIVKNMTFSDIPESKRIKMFTIDFSQEDIERLISRVVEARNYYNLLLT